MYDIQELLHNTLGSQSIVIRNSYETTELKLTKIKFPFSRDSTTDLGTGAGYISGFPCWHYDLV